MPFVGRAEEWIVCFKVAILLLFVFAGLWSVDTKSVADEPVASSPAYCRRNGVFLAYEGLNL